MGLTGHHGWKRNFGKIVQTILLQRHNLGYLMCGKPMNIEKLIEF